VAASAPNGLGGGGLGGGGLGGGLDGGPWDKNTFFLLLL